MFSLAVDKESEDINTTFLLTINTNTKPRDEEEAVNIRKYTRIKVKEMFQNFEDFIDIYKSRDPTKTKLKINFNNIANNVSVVPRIEIGENMGRVHAHILVRWMAPSNYFFQVDMKKLRKWVHDNIGQGVYLNIRHIKTDEHALRYINKTLV